MFVIAEIGISGNSEEVANVDVLANVDASLGVDGGSEVEASADVDLQGPVRGGAGNSGSRGGVGILLAANWIKYSSQFAVCSASPSTTSSSTTSPTK